MVFWHHIQVLRVYNIIFPAFLPFSRILYDLSLSTSSDGRTSLSVHMLSSIIANHSFDKRSSSDDPSHI